MLAAMGGHVIKTGCGPYLNDWIARGIAHTVAMNGSAAIHDLELAIAGHTSEDVGAAAVSGTFGFARETSELFVAACNRPVLSEASAWVRHWARSNPGARRTGSRRKRAGHRPRHKLPVTVHVAIGTDIVHMTPRLERRRSRPGQPGRLPHALRPRCPARGGRLAQPGKCRHHARGLPQDGFGRPEPGLFPRLA